MNDQQLIFKVQRELYKMCDAINPSNPIALPLVELSNEVQNYVYANHYADWMRKEQFKKDQTILPLYHHAE